MRSELVFDAMEWVPNRFLLMSAAAKATRRFHKPNTRIQDTVNEVLARFHQADPIKSVKRIADDRCTLLRRAG